MKYIAPSILAADFANLERDVEMLNGTACDYLHCDVMDGRFVPNISFGMPVLKAIKRVAKKPLDVHLMIEDPGRYVNEFRDCGADILTVHYEGNVHMDRLLNQIKAAGMKAGLAINPGTPPEALKDLLYAADLVLIMSVNPGFGGQSFLENTYGKTMRLNEMRSQGRRDFMIEIDGGVNADNAQKLCEAGADMLVAGSAVFKADDPAAMVQTLKDNANSAD